MSYNLYNLKPSECRWLNKHIGSVDFQTMLNEFLTIGSIGVADLDYVYCTGMELRNQPNVREVLKTIKRLDTPRAIAFYGDLSKAVEATK